MVVVVVGDGGLWCWVVVGGGGGDGWMKPQLGLYVKLGEMLGEGFSQVVSEP
ncbi:hypothetical protein Tco_1366885, partial [Tanacetum coccineum]